MCAECANSKQCSPAKHHYDECVERVTNASDDDGEGEDCVEECKPCPFLPISLAFFPRRGLYMLSLRLPSWGGPTD